MNANKMMKIILELFTNSLSAVPVLPIMTRVVIPFTLILCMYHS